MASKAVRQGLKQVKPILSTNRDEAKRRVLNLYKAWYRQIPYVGECLSLTDFLMAFRMVTKVFAKGIYSCQVTRSGHLLEKQNKQLQQQKHELLSDHLVVKEECTQEKCIQKHLIKCMRRIRQ